MVILVAKFTSTGIKTFLHENSFDTLTGMLSVPDELNFEYEELMLKMIETIETKG